MMGHVAGTQIRNPAELRLNALFPGQLLLNQLFSGLFTTDNLGCFPERSIAMLPPGAYRNLHVG